MDGSHNVPTESPLDAWHAALRSTRTPRAAVAAWLDHGPRLAAVGHATRRVAEQALRVHVARLLGLTSPESTTAFLAGIVSQLRAERAAGVAVAPENDGDGRAELLAAVRRNFVGRHDGPAWRLHLANSTHSHHAANSFAKRRAVFLEAGVFEARCHDAIEAVRRCLETEAREGRGDPSYVGHGAALALIRSKLATLRGIAA